MELPENDFRFEIITLPEPELGCTHRVRQIERVVTPADDQWPVATLVDGDVMEDFTTDDPYGFVEAAREAQAHPLEERLEPFGLEWQREQEEHARGGW